MDDQRVLPCQHSRHPICCWWVHLKIWILSKLWSHCFFTSDVCIRKRRFKEQDSFVEYVHTDKWKKAPIWEQEQSCFQPLVCFLIIVHGKEKERERGLQTSNIFCLFQTINIGKQEDWGEGKDSIRQTKIRTVAFHGWCLSICFSTLC